MHFTFVIKDDKICVVRLNCRSYVSSLILHMQVKIKEEYQCPEK